MEKVPLQLIEFRKSLLLVLTPMYSICRFSQWMYSKSRELRVVNGGSTSKRALSVHDIVNKMGKDFIEVLPAIHKLIGCDITNKVRTTTYSFQAATNYEFELLHSFAKSDITERMLLSPEKFLVRCLDKKPDALRNQIYYAKTFQLNLEKLPPTSGSIILHILRAYLQCKL